MPVTGAGAIKSCIFFCLLIDLLAFTIPLPLFPRLVDHFLQKEAFSASHTTLSRSLGTLRAFRSRLIPKSLSAFDEAIARKHDVVLLGGAMGSLFSLAQHASAPWIGRAADKYGRRLVLLLSMIGNILSAVVWLFSANFGVYLIGRLIGGLSECNVQLALASLADITPADKRARSMALVGIAFSIAFVTGPVIGAKLSTADLPALPYLDPKQLNIYAFPAAMTIWLLGIETFLLALFMPETMHSARAGDTKEVALKGSGLRLRQLESLHLHYLFIFSGCEFSLSFLCFDLFGYSNREQGYLLGSMGLLAAVLQGSVVRRGRLSARQLSLIGLASCLLSLISLSLLPIFRAALLLRFAAACLAVTSATVVTSLTALASAEASATEQGAVLGRFRSKGQLGRALGPLAAVSLYWSAGPTPLYALSALGMLALLARTMAGKGVLAQERQKQE